MVFGGSQIERCLAVLIFGLHVHTRLEEELPSEEEEEEELGTN